MHRTRSNCVKTCSIRFKTQYDVNKIKEKTAVLCDYFVDFDFSCSGCGVNYIGKTERTLYEKTVEYAWTDNNSAVYKHLNDCPGIQHLINIASFHPSLFTSSSPNQRSDELDLRTAPINLVQDKAKVIDRHKNWNILLETFKVALKIKELNPILNSGLKTSKELQLFDSMVTLHTFNCLSIQLIPSLAQS